MPQPWSSITRFNPDFVMFLICKSSSTITAWLLLSLVVNLCRVSWRILVILVCRRVIFSFNFRQLFENFTFLAKRFCSRLILSCQTFTSIGSSNWPSDRVHNRLTPISIPTIDVTGWTGWLISISTWIETYQCFPWRETVTFLGIPSISRDFLKYTQPIFGRNTRLPSILKPCGKVKLSRPPRFLKVGIFFKGTKS